MTDSRLGVSAIRMGSFGRICDTPEISRPRLGSGCTVWTLFTDSDRGSLITRGWADSPFESVEAGGASLAYDLDWDRTLGALFILGA